MKQIQEMPRFKALVIPSDTKRINVGDSTIHSKFHPSQSLRKSLVRHYKVW